VGSRTAMLRLLKVFAAGVTLAVLLAEATALSGSARTMPYNACGGHTIKRAPWTMGVQDPIGLRVIRGTKYFIWSGSAGPPCDVATRAVARLAQLRTARAVRAASFGGLQCRASAPDRPAIWVRPRGAWGGCWSVPQVAAGRYFFWELRVPRAR
jgi:hypothetical protein